MTIARIGSHWAKVESALCPKFRVLDDMELAANAAVVFMVLRIYAPIARTTASTTKMTPMVERSPRPTWALIVFLRASMLLTLDRSATLSVEHVHQDVDDDSSHDDYR